MKKKKTYNAFNVDLYSRRIWRMAVDCLKEQIKIYDKKLSGGEALKSFELRDLAFSIRTMRECIEFAKTPIVVLSSRAKRQAEQAERIALETNKVAKKLMEIEKNDGKRVKGGYPKRTEVGPPIMEAHLKDYDNASALTAMQYDFGGVEDFEEMMDEIDGDDEDEGEEV